MNAADQIRLALQQENQRFKQPPPTFSKAEEERIRSMFRAIREEYPGYGGGFDLAKRRVLAALLQTSVIYEHFAIRLLFESVPGWNIFAGVCRDLIDEGLPVKTYEADVYSDRGFERKSLVLELV
jgi:hypothetical protein